jgi:hypothetical protein
MKNFYVFVNYDSGRRDEYEIEAESLEDVYYFVYQDIGYDPGEVCVEEISEEVDND